MQANNEFMKYNLLQSRLYLAPFPRYDVAKSETILPYYKPHDRVASANYVIKLGRQIKALGYILVKTAWS